MYFLKYFFYRNSKDMESLKKVSSKITPSFQQLSGVMKSSFGSIRYKGILLKIISGYNPK